MEKDNGQTWKDNEIVYVKERIYILNNRKIWKQVLQENYDLTDIRYSKQQRMLKLIKRNYLQLGIKADIKKYVQEYTKYQ